MSELIEEYEEYEEPKTHSIVSCATDNPCELRSGHIGKLVTYKGVTGWLIRYVTTCTHHLLALSITEVRDCLNLPENKPPAEFN